MKRNMIKNIKRFTGLVAIASSIIFNSCQGESEVYNPDSDVISDLEDGIMDGNLYQDYTLNPNIRYKLEGAFVVRDGATLTIPAGTKIEAHKGGSNIYLIALPTAKINVNGTVDNPVVIGTEDGEPGGWGGFSLFGLAHSNGVRSINQNLYGGEQTVGTNIENDNSGSISYLNIIGSGNSLNTEENFNGFSLFGIGSGTTINNVAIINSKDDGIEFFGGSVSVSNLYIENTADDSIDWTEGWNGSISNGYVLNSGSFSAALEGDFVQIDNNNPEAFDFPTITNLTVVSTEDDTSTTDIALQFKNESGAFISGLNIDGYDIDLDMVDGGALSNLSIEGMTPDADLLAPYNISDVAVVQASSTIVDLQGSTIILANGTEILIDDTTTIEQDSLTITVDADTITIGDIITVLTEVIPDREYILNSGKDSNAINPEDWTWIRRSLDE